MDENYQFLMNQVRNFNASRIILTATELELWEALAGNPASTRDLATQKDLDTRALGILLDALASIGILLGPLQNPKRYLPNGLHTLSVQWKSLPGIVHP